MIPSRLPKGTDVESFADCKKAVKEYILGAPYQSTIHQKRLTQILPFTSAVMQRSRSLRKLLKDLDQLLQDARRRRGRKRP